MFLKEFVSIVKQSFNPVEFKKKLFDEPREIQVKMIQVMTRRYTPDLKCDWKELFKYSFSKFDTEKISSTTWLKEMEKWYNDKKVGGEVTLKDAFDWIENGFEDLTAFRNRCSGTELRYICLILNRSYSSGICFSDLFNAIHPLAYKHFKKHHNIEELFSLIWDKKLISRFYFFGKRIPFSLTLCEKDFNAIFEKLNFEMTEKSISDLFFVTDYDLKPGSKKIQIHKDENIVIYSGHSMKERVSLDLKNQLKTITNSLYIVDAFLFDLTKIVITDCLYYDSNFLLDFPLHERIKILQSNFKTTKNCFVAPFEFSEGNNQKRCVNEKLINLFSNRNTQEKFVIKKADGYYIPGMVNTIRFLGYPTFNLAVVGVFGNVSKKLNICCTELLMACLNSKTNKYESVTKCCFDKYIIKNKKTNEWFFKGYSGTFTKSKPKWLELNPKFKYVKLIATNKKKLMVFEMSCHEISYDENNQFEIKFPYLVDKEQSGVGSREFTYKTDKKVSTKQHLNKLFSRITYMDISEEEGETETEESDF